MEFAKEPVSCKKLLGDYQKRRRVIETDRIRFLGAEGCDVYNITEPFLNRGHELIAARVERRDNEISCVKFFKKKAKNEYELYCDTALNNVQDPFVTVIDGELVLGGVQIDTNPLDERHIINYRTIFFKGKDVESLKFWFTGPNRMKDIRLLDYSDDSLLILTRPQGGKFGMGKIGMALVKKGEADLEEAISSAPTFETHFIEGEWGGANKLYRLKNGLVGVLGHISYMDDTEIKGKHYHAMAFALDVERAACTPVKIIAARCDFKEGEYKREDIKDVIFPGGLIRNPGGTATLYAGVSDAEAHYVEIEDPFIEYER